MIGGFSSALPLLGNQRNRKNDQEQAEHYEPILEPLINRSQIVNLKRRS